jgi:hypothetical protein
MDILTVISLKLINLSPEHEQGAIPAWRRYDGASIDKLAPLHRATTLLRIDLFFYFFILQT